jgi:RNA polymerase sigma-54 factor
MDLMRAAPPSSRQQADPGIRLEPLQRSELRALPGLLRSLRLLPLGHEALLGAVERALDDNPMLERLPGSVCAVCGRHQVSERCPRCRGLVRAPDTTPSVLPFETLEAAAGCEIRSDCREVLPVVIAHLTPRGLLDAEPGEIAAEHGLAPASVAEAVRAIKAVGPPGVAETSVTDLLLVQARLLVDAGAAAPWFAEVVREHLQEVATGNTVAVAAAVGVPEEEVAAAFRLIRARLRPLASVETRPRAEVPAGVDVFVYRSRSGVLEVEVPDSRWFGLGLASVPPRIRADAEAATWLADQERAARELMHQLDIRGGVLRRVARTSSSGSRGTSTAARPGTSRSPGPRWPPPSGCIRRR